MKTENIQRDLPADERRAYRDANTTEYPSGYTIWPDSGIGVGWVLEAPVRQKNGELKALGGHKRYYGTLEKAQARHLELTS